LVFDTYELITFAAAVTAILLLGTTHLRNNLAFYSLHTFLIGVATAWIAHSSGQFEMYWVAFFFALFKAILIPRFLSWVIDAIEVDSDAGAFIVAPIAMSAGVGMLGVSYLLSYQLPGLPGDHESHLGAVSAMSILFTGVLLMLARRIAISQITGFLVLENGIYLFALTQTHGMPLIIEMGALLELLGGVMIFGLLTFRIKKSFEHIDVTQLSELRES
jgi:hydrogenase-4 component E